MITFILLILFHFLIFFVYFLSSKNGEESPSAGIYNILKKEGKKRSVDILKFFNDREMISGRLDDLEGKGMIKKQGNKYVATGKGKAVAGLVGIYKKVIGIREGG